jgi:DNA-binding NarL/FixJ family response regulator
MAEVAKGKTDKEVGATLRLSAKTVRNYLDRSVVLSCLSRRNHLSRYVQERGGREYGGAWVGGRIVPRIAGGR